MLCEICDGVEVEWVHQLDPAKASFGKYGKGHIWSSRIYVCEPCDELYRNGDFEALVSLQVGTADLAPDVIDETIRKPFAVYCAAYERSVDYHDLLPPGVRALRDEGFVPVSELTGDDKTLADAWPPEHRHSVLDTRPQPARLREPSPGSRRYWLIRSPWPNVSIADAFSVIWDYVEPRAPIENYCPDPDQQRAAIAQFAALDETQLVSLIAAHRKRENDT